MLEVDVVVLASVLRREVRAYAEGVVEELARALEEGGLRPSPHLLEGEEEAAAHKVRGVGAVIALATGGTERAALSLYKSNPSKPAVLVVSNVANSLAAGLELIPRLRGMTNYLGCLFVRRWGEVPAGKVKGLIKAFWLPEEVRGMRLGLIGAPSPWLISSVPGREDLGRIGFELDPVGMEDLLRELASSAPHAREVKEVLGRAENVAVGEEEVVKAMRLYRALKALAERRRWSALTLSCFEVLRRTGSSPCLALALLNDEGIVAGCEGDLSSTALMCICRALTGLPSWMANPVDMEEEVLTLAHCTIPLRLVESFSLKTHFETGLSVAIDGVLPEGVKVTLARMDGGLRRLMAFKGVVTESHMGLPYHCRTQVRVKVHGDLENLIFKSLGNHLVLTLGDRLRELRLAASRLGLEFAGI